MSFPNPKRRAYRRWEDCRIWRELFAACIANSNTPWDMPTIAKHADAAYAQYRERFPVQSPAALDTEQADEDSTAQQKEKMQ